MLVAQCVKAEVVFEFAFHDGSPRGPFDDMRSGVAERDRTDISGPTTRGSAIELRPPLSARGTGLDGRSRTDAGLRHLNCNQAPSTTWLRRARKSFRSRVPEPPNRCGRFASPSVSAPATSVEWRLVPDLNRRPPARQAGTLAAELTKRANQRFRSRVPEPPNRCGRFASHGVSACATSG